MILIKGPSALSDFFYFRLCMICLQNPGQCGTGLDYNVSLLSRSMKEWEKKTRRECP